LLSGRASATGWGAGGSSELSTDRLLIRVTL
jgi:hypothetical protein